MDTQTVSAPVTETVTATKAAADKGDVSTFLEADRQTRAGKPVAKIERPAQTDAGAPGRAAKPSTASGPSDEDRKADERLVSRVREAVESATASSTREISDLKRRLDEATRSTTKPAAEGRTDATATGPTRIEIKKYAALPDAPKLDDKDASGAFVYETAQEHAVALSLFIGERQSAERAEASTRSQRDVQRTHQEVERVTAFAGRINDFKKTDPDFGKRLSPEVAGIHGFAKLQEINGDRQKQGLPPIPATVDHAIGELIYDSEIPAEVALHLSTTPADLALLRKATSPAQLSKAFGRIEDRIAASKSPAADAADSTNKTPTAAQTRERAAAVVDRSVSSAVVPQTNLGQPGSKVDPLDVAVAKGDVSTFLELDRQRMAERRGLRTAS